MSHLEAQFQQAAATAGGGYLLVDDSRPIDLFVGVDGGKRSLLLKCNREPSDLPQLEIITVTGRMREDGMWALMLQLQRPELTGLFTYLVADLIRSTRTCRTNDDAAAALIERLRWWQRLLSKARTRALEEHVLRGLIGELLFLLHHAIPAVGAPASIASWVGPFEAPRDFRFPDRDIEIKVVHRDSRSLQISSLEQLADLGVPLRLAVVSIDLCNASVPGSTSVTMLVSRIRSLCEPDAELVAAFDERLWAIGYSELDEYDAFCFAAQEFEFYNCDSGFPRIVSSMVPAGILECIYHVDLRAITSFAVPDWKT